MKKAVSAVLTMILLLGISACGSDVESDANLGVWKAATAELLGVSMSVEELFTEGFTIELQANGKCTLNIDGEKADGTWALKEGALTISGEIDCAGRLENGRMTLENVLDMGISISFTKAGS